MSNLASINTEQRVYVLNHGEGYTCLGFDVAQRRMEAIAEWVGVMTPPICEPGTRGHYAAYQELMALAEKHSRLMNQQCPAELTPQLTALEGRRVEVEDCYGDVRRFWVGRSLGWMPCHLEIARTDSSGGGAVTGAPFKRVSIIR